MVCTESVPYLLSALTANEAIQIVANCKYDIHLLMTDVILELIKNILGYYREITCIFMSGCTDDVIEHHGLLEETISPRAVRDKSTRFSKSLAGSLVIIFN
jgi:hypothetical protein